MMVHVANARKDFLNKFVHELIARFNRIVLEDLRVAARWFPAASAMSILDAGWSYLVSHLAQGLKVLVARSSRSIRPTRPRRARVAVPSSSTFRSGIVGSSALAACPSIGTTTPRSSSSKGAGMSPWALSLPTGGFAQKPHDFSRGGVSTMCPAR